MSLRIAIDTGGTFTDVVIYDEETGVTRLRKIPSTPDNPGEAILQGIVQLCEQEGMQLDDISMVIHGTTVATNAILERKGARTALLTTRGFRDILHIMRQDRPRLYDLRARRPLPLVERGLRLEADERMLYDGTIHHPLEEQSVAELAPLLKSEKIKSLAVCFLHSYVNDQHEIRAGEILNEEFPELEITLSSELIPEFKEYERMSTTVINAYVKPILKRYLSNIVANLAAAGVSSEFYVMKSNGGIMAAEAGSKYGVHTILSGPAGGVLASVHLAERTGHSNIITVDMGGTSFDISLVSGGTPGFAPESEIGGHALKVPMLDIHTIGAGGGSIAWIDRGGALRVGPLSAGADPGPAAYQRGGEDPTVTDANLILGRLNPDYFLGGAMAVDPVLSRKVIEEKIANPLDMSVLEAAEGIIKVINASMTKGIRHVSVQRGHDPREFAMVAFGGAGPLHASELANDLDIPEVIVPPAPGLESAFGLLEADLRQDYVQTRLAGLSDDLGDELCDLFQKMEERAVDFFGTGKIDFRRTLDLRYEGQGYELEVPFKGIVSETTAAFHSSHEQQYGFARKEVPVQLVNLRLSAVRTVKKVSVKEKSIETGTAGAPRTERDVYLNGESHSCAVFEREQLKPGDRISGPAIVEQIDTSTLLFPDDEGQIDGFGNLVIQVGM